MAKRKLKGKNVGKLKPEQKEKLEKTLKRMDEAREQDSKRLRDLIKEKIETHKKEVQIANTYIDTTNKKIREVIEVKLRNEGAILSLGEILKNASKV